MSEQILETPPTTPVTESATTTPANTQSTSQADIAATEPVKETNIGISKEANITKKEPVPEPAPVVAEPVKTPVKHNYEDMIEGFIDGDLEDADYEAIEATGLSREDFTLIAEGRKALQERNTNQLYEFAGGRDAYDAIKDYASTNLGDEEISAFNQAISSNNPKLARIAVLGLKALHEAENGSRPSTRIESDGSSDSAKGYESQQELLTDMKNRKYGKDKSYTAEVNARRAKSAY